jgi:hypothetical protein
MSALTSFITSFPPNCSARSTNDCFAFFAQISGCEKRFFHPCRKRAELSKLALMDLENPAAVLRKLETVTGFFVPFFSSET